LGRPIVSSTLRFLGSDQVFPNDGHDTVNPIPHLSHVLERGPMGRWLLLPGLFGDIEQAAGLSPEQKFEWCESRGGLGDFSDSEEDVRQHLVPIPAVVRSHATEHLLQRLIESLH
jgi:hypothetical protein